MTLTIGFSPCPNDTFIFDALVNKKINTGDMIFEPVLEDVETLNQWAMEGKLDITKLSFPAFFGVTEEYALLDAGSAMGLGAGPLLISKKNKLFTRDDIIDSSIAIPGIHTTANFLLSHAFPEAKNKLPMLFSDIEDAVLSGKTDLGVIIHENRFTYRDKGLIRQLDLGEQWEKETKMPLPLGGIAIKRKWGPATVMNLEKLIRMSIDNARQTYPALSAYVQQYAQTMSEEVMRKHIDLYVNDFSVSMGTEGRKAIETLYEVYQRESPEMSMLSSNPLFLS
ncbi:MAG TPA: 1,4-dihydroxy-6-naphthoate synthase [Chitinophagaceae bacterium]|nr:1,4-dihydroxy-6-naphthoate synthase [Chitinophagaceae bacterium]